MDDDLEGSRRARWSGLVGLTTVRLWKRATQGGSRRVLTTIGAVAVTIALLLVVTGVAVGLADGGLTSENDADVAVMADSTTTLSTIDGVEGPRLGATTERTETLHTEDGVDHASPVLLETARLEAGNGEERTVLLVGVDPDEESRTVAGLPTDGLTNEGDAVLSRTVADDLEASDGDGLTVSSVRTDYLTDDPSLSVTAVEDTETAATGGDPVVLVHLEELRTIADSENRDLANHVLVWGDPAAEDAAAETYPNATVETTAGADPTSLFGDGLALATSLLALVIGVVISASFVATTMGMTVDEDRETLAVLTAVGFPARSRLAMVTLSTTLTTLAGALVGLVLGAFAVVAVNGLAAVTTTPGAVAVLHPLFVPYAVAVSLLAGLVAAPYPLAIATRTTVLEEIGR